MDVLGKVADMDGPKFNFRRMSSRFNIQTSRITFNA